MVQALARFSATAGLGEFACKEVERAVGLTSDQRLGDSDGDVRSAPSSVVATYANRFRSTDERPHDGRVRSEQQSSRSATKPHPPRSGSEPRPGVAASGPKAPART